MEHKMAHSRLLLFLFMSLLLPATTAAEHRVALVIGISDYKEAPLRNPLNDARDVSQALLGLGFEVIEVTNATKKQMLDAVNDFGVRLQQAQVALFYYAGHGVQYHGKNYLIPLQTTIDTPADLEQEAVDAGRILGRMEQGHSALNIVVLDACRNNPFRNLIGFRSYGERGLVALAPPVRGSIIAYATQPDNVAADGAGRNGTYTKHLLRYLNKPGLSLAALFNEVGIAVSEETNGKQVPWMNSSPLPPFCFAGCEPELKDTPKMLKDTPEMLKDIPGKLKDIPQFTDIIWQFGRGNASIIIIANIQLRPDGTIGGYSHPNESRWAFEGNELLFYHSDGRPSARFTTFYKINDKWVISGPFLSDGQITMHVLKEVGRAQAK